MFHGVVGVLAVTPAVAVRGPVRSSTGHRLRSTPALRDAVARLLEGAGLPVRSLAQLALAVVGGVLRYPAPWRLQEPPSKVLQSLLRLDVEEHLGGLQVSRSMRTSVQCDE